MQVQGAAWQGTGMLGQATAATLRTSRLRSDELLRLPLAGEVRCGRERGAVRARSLRVTPSGRRSAERGEGKDLTREMWSTPPPPTPALPAPRPLALRVSLVAVRTKKKVRVGVCVRVGACPCVCGREGGCRNVLRPYRTCPRTCPSSHSSHAGLATPFRREGKNDDDRGKCCHRMWRFDYSMYRLRIREQRASGEQKKEIKRLGRKKYLYTVTR